MIFLDFNIVQTLMLSIFLYLFGSFLTNKIHILYKLCIPPPVVGGLLFSLLVFSSVSTFDFSISSIGKSSVDSVLFSVFSFDVVLIYFLIPKYNPFLIFLYTTKLL